MGIVRCVVKNDVVIHVWCIFYHYVLVVMSRSVFCCGELYKASVIFTKLIECNVDKVVFHLVCGYTPYYVKREFLSIEEFTLGIVSGWHRGHCGTTLRRTLSYFFKDIVRFCKHWYWDTFILAKILRNLYCWWFNLACVIFYTLRNDRWI